MFERHAWWGVVALSPLSCQLEEPPPKVPSPAISAEMPAAAAPPVAAPTPSATPIASVTLPPPPSPEPKASMRKFDEDVAFLNLHGAAVKVLQAPEGGRIAISGAYQARIMTSALEAGGSSLGFIN